MAKVQQVIWSVVAVVLLGASAAGEQTAKRYLTPGAIDILAILPPAPVAGEPRYDADRAIFRATRRLQGTPRWDLAVNDVRWGDDVMLADFSCATGLSLKPAMVPKLLALVHKANTDTLGGTDAAKNVYKRVRPFHLDQGATCQPASELGDSYDYPSGHTTGGWTWALVLADVMPDRASDILARGRAYGESRIVCGAHNASAVDAGRLSATVTMTVVRNTPAYQQDLKAARLEMSRLRKVAAAPASCDAEKALIAQNIFANAP